MAFETPAIWFPGMESEEIDFEIARMLERSHQTWLWQSGQISLMEWVDAMEQLGVNMLEASSDWARGISYI